MTRLLVTLIMISTNVVAFGADSLPRLHAAPQRVEQLWAGYDPRSEPLEVRVVREWREDDLTLRYVIYSIGTLKGEPARMAAFYGFPTGEKKLPAVLHMHGGGQRAFLQVVKRYAKRGYAALSVNWGGRPMEDAQADDPNTDWGAVDPTQNNVGGYSNLLPQDNTIDPFPSARNNNWFLLTIGYRRGITFLQQQPEVDADRIGVFGHSMGGRLTGMVAGSDERGKAASPSVGGSGFLQTDLWGLPGSSRRVKGDVDLFQRTIAGQSYLARVRCPILYLRATNDFNAPMDFVEKGMRLVPHEKERTTYAPHLNHRFTPDTEIVRPLWFDSKLQQRFQFSQSPTAALILNRDTGIPVFRVSPNPSLPIEGGDDDLAATSAQANDPREADVIVYGSTPGGFCAAIAAAREHASVILLEPTDHIGAMNTGGLSHCDSNQMVRSTLMGLFDEWHTRVVKDYTDRGLKAPYDPAKKDQSKWCFEPHVAMRVTKQMLDQAGVTVLTERYLKSVTKEGPRLKSLVTKNGTFTARVFVDGSYEGDLMAAAGVDWTIGREGRDEYGESLAGKQYPKKKMNINGLDENGRLLPLLTTDDAGPDEVGDEKIMTYSFRLCLTTDANNRVPMPKPENYDPARFEIVRRALKAGENRVGFDLYPLPGEKLDGNNSIGGQFSIGLVGGGNEWHSADEERRKTIWEAHKQYTLEFFHFLTTDPAVPAAMRTRYTKLGLCKDEFASYDHFSPALYVRESRRMKGMYVISQKDILEEPDKDDPIAISSFPIDSHDVQRVAFQGGGVINEGTIFPVRNQKLRQGYAYHVPYRSILPKPEECDNLLVPVALSCTHVGISSLRIEGAWMVIGQGAGVAAALAADQDVAVQELDYEKLRERLLAQRQVLELPDVSELPSVDGSIAAKTLPGIVLDDMQAKLTGKWSRSTNFKPYIESGYVFSGEQDSKSKGDGKATATFRFTAPKSGRYQLLMAYSAHETRAKNVPVTVSSGTHNRNIVVDQTMPLPDGKHFRPIDTVDLEANVETVIQITNTDTAGFVILDALQLQSIEPELKSNE